MAACTVIAADDTIVEGVRAGGELGLRAEWRREGEGAQWKGYTSGSQLFEKVFGYTNSKADGRCLGSDQQSKGSGFYPGTSMQITGHHIISG